jgi:hypothetical protein
MAKNCGPKVHEADEKRSPHAGRVEGLEAAGGPPHTWKDWVEPDRTGHFYGAYQATRNQG